MPVFVPLLGFSPNLILEFGLNLRFGALTKLLNECLTKSIKKKLS